MASFVLVSGTFMTLTRPLSSILTGPITCPAPPAIRKKCYLCLL